jgi:hypothetical protein
MNLKCEKCGKEYFIKDASHKRAIKRESESYCSLDCRYGTAEERFKSRVFKNTITGCWEWIGHFRPNGYGFLKIEKKAISAHRFSYELHNGPITDDMLVCHKCDNRSCVNPEHLFLGTYSDNMQDCSDKGRLKVPDTNRFKEGDKPHNSKLSQETFVSIKNLIAQGDISLKKVSVIMNVPYQTVRDMKRGKSYS